MIEVKRYKAVINDKPYKPYAYCEESSDGLYVRFEDYADLQQKLDARGVDLEERAELIHAYSKTQCEFAEQLNCDSDNESILKSIHNLQQKLDAVLAENVAPKKCCEPTDEELKLLRDGDYNAEELWGVGGKKSCPKCAGRKTPTTDAILNEVRAEGVEYVAKHMDSLQHNLMVSSTSLREYATQLRTGSNEGGV